MKTKIAYQNTTGRCSVALTDTLEAWPAAAVIIIPKHWFQGIQKMEPRRRNFHPTNRPLAGAWH